jgi:hypothetical protein
MAPFMAQPKDVFSTTRKAALVLLLVSVLISVGYVMMVDGILGSIALRCGETAASTLAALQQASHDQNVHHKNC